MRRPSSASVELRGASGRDQRGSRISTRASVRPSTSGASWRLIVSTSGSSGIALQLMRDRDPAHEPLLRLAIAPALGPRVRVEVDVLQALGREVGVDLGGRQIGVAEHLLQRAQVAAPGEQVGGERVAQRVRAHPARRGRPRARGAWTILYSPWRVSAAARGG